MIKPLARLDCSNAQAIFYAIQLILAQYLVITFNIPKLEKYLGYSEGNRRDALGINPEHSGKLDLNIVCVCNDVPRIINRAVKFLLKMPKSFHGVGFGETEDG